MGTLKEKFEELSAGIKAFGKPAAAWFPKYTSTSLLNASHQLSAFNNEVVHSTVMSKSISAKKNMSSGGRR